MPLDPALFRPPEGGHSRRSSSCNSSHESWPEPEVPERPATTDEVSRGPKAVAKAAERGGWEHREIYSRGYWPKNHEPVLCDLLSVRVQDHARRRRGFALYRDGKAIETWVYDPRNPTRWRRCSVTDLKKLMQDDGGTR